LRKDIHPKYYSNAVVTCSCGNTFTTGSTFPELKVEICSACHPFYTGEAKIIDTEGRVERFERKSAAAEAQRKKYTAKAVAKRAKADAQKIPPAPKSLKEMMKGV
jgi:large subunit ribosomal protein L31